MSNARAEPLAAILYTPEDRVEEIMLEAAHRLTARGVRLGGILQHDIGMQFDDPCAMELENLATGERFSLSQNLGSNSEACRLDPAALAHAAVAVRAAIDNGTDLICINKFASQEAYGTGLRSEMGEVVAAGIPLLTSVGKRFLSDWEAFSGGMGELLEPSVESILAWWERVEGED